MLKSMTGFGRAEQTVNEKSFLVEIKSLNGKQFEINLKIPPVLKSYEFDVRNMLQETLLRGSVDCLITIKQNGSAKPVVVNTDLIKAYYKQIATLADELAIDTNSVLAALLRLPEVVSPSNEILAEEDWSELQKVVQAALQELNNHRSEEGRSIETELHFRIKNIHAQEEEILKLEPIRRKRLKDELVKMLEENVGKESYDPNRLEQELIYYIEKLDITEEQVRLKNHCEYFSSILNDHEEAKGKKLSFVLQEIGREINTTGSKAYDSEIQKCVVLMKDELEKLKEQILNVL
ncbi:MAG: YicC/YloC family endoribonuclease [Ginsengibacter sp.]